MVTEISPKEIVTRLSFSGKSGNSIVVFDHNWNRVINGRWKFTPNDGIGLSFPLAVGKEWRDEHNERNLQSGAHSSTTGRSRIVAQESITNSAGTFDTFKMERQTQTINAADPSRRTVATILLWYAPQINHWVRRTIITKVDKRISLNETDELTDFARKEP